MKSPLVQKVLNPNVLTRTDIKMKLVTIRSLILLRTGTEVTNSSAGQILIEY